MIPHFGRGMGRCQMVIVLWHATFGHNTGRAGPFRQRASTSILVPSIANSICVAWRPPARRETWKRSHPWLGARASPTSSAFRGEPGGHSSRRPGRSAPSGSVSPKKKGRKGSEAVAGGSGQVRSDSCTRKPVAGKPQKGRKRTREESAAASGACAITAKCPYPRATSTEAAVTEI